MADGDDGGASGGSHPINERSNQYYCDIFSTDDKVLHDLLYGLKLIEGKL